MRIKNLTKGKVIGIVVGCIVLVIVAVYISSNQEQSAGEIGTSNNQTKEEIEKRKEIKADKSILVASMKQEIVVDSNGKGVFNIENLPENNYDIKVQIIVRDKKEEKIYESEKIQPGYILREGVLDRKLEKGSYGCIARILGYDSEGNQVKTSDIQINITVEK